MAQIPQCLEYRTTKEVIPLVFPLFIFFTPFSLPFFRHEEDDEEVTIGMCVDAVARPRTLAECNKGRCIRLHAHPTPRIPRHLHRGIWLLYAKWVTQLPWACQCLGF
jgi:hypothetical protein